MATSGPSIVAPPHAKADDPEPDRPGRVDRGRKARAIVARGRHTIEDYRGPMAAQTRLFLCLKDNFGVLVHDPASGATAAIDAPEAAPIESALKATGGRLPGLRRTHPHRRHA